MGYPLLGYPVVVRLLLEADKLPVHHVGGYGCGSESCYITFAGFAHGEGEAVGDFCSCCCRSLGIPLVVYPHSLYALLAATRGPLVAFCPRLAFLCLEAGRQTAP